MNTTPKMIASLCAGIALSYLLLNNATAQDLSSKLSNVSLVSVDRMVLTNNGSAYLVAVDLTFQNLNPSGLRFRNGDLNVSLKTVRPDGSSGQVCLGPSHLDTVVLPGGSTNSPGTVSATANIQMGPVNDETTARLVQLFNAVSDPGNKVSLLLQGTSLVDLPVTPGWVGNNTPLYVDLAFKPALQRNVLLN